MGSSIYFPKPNDFVQNEAVLEMQDTCRLLEASTYSGTIARKAIHPPSSQLP